MEWVNKNIDKIAHFFVSFFILVVGMLFMSTLAATSVAVLLGLLKEARDHVVNNNWDNKDLVADLGGIISGLVYKVLLTGLPIFD